MEAVDDADSSMRDNVKDPLEQELNKSLVNFHEEHTFNKSPSERIPIMEEKIKSAVEDSTQCSTSEPQMTESHSPADLRITSEEKAIKQVISESSTANDQQTLSSNEMNAQCPMEIENICENVNCNENLISKIETDSTPHHSNPSSMTASNLISITEENDKDCSCESTINENKSSAVHETSVTLENDFSSQNDTGKEPNGINKDIMTTVGDLQIEISQTPGQSKSNTQNSFFKPQSDSESSESVETSESSDSETSESEESAKEVSAKKDFTKTKSLKDKNKIKGELDLEDLPPIEELQITVAEEECEPLGKVYSIVNQLVVVESLPNTPALDLDSILFRAKGVPFGHIFDVFGPVKSPYYCVRFNSNSDILEKGIQTGELIYCAPQTEHTKYVFTYQLMQQKGSDASWKHNHEPPPNLIEYSDDEEERKARNRNNKPAFYKSNVEDSDGPRRKHLKTRNWNNKFANYNTSDGFRQSVRPMMLPQPPTFVPPIPVRPPTPGPFSAPPATRMAPPFESRSNRPRLMNGSPTRPPAPHMLGRPPFSPPGTQFPSRLIGPSPFPPPPTDFPPQEQIHPEQSFPLRPQQHPLTHRGFHTNPPFAQNTPPRPPPPSPPSMMVSNQSFRSGMTLPPFSSSCRPPPRQVFQPPRPPPFTQRSYPVFGQQPLFPPSPSPPPSYSLSFPHNRPPIP